LHHWAGGGYALGARPKYVQNMRKHAQKYARNACNPEMGLCSLPHMSQHPGAFVTKYDDIFEQKIVLIILSTFIIPPENIRSFEEQVFWDVQKY
jgi:hypothetical protein